MGITNWGMFTFKNALHSIHRLYKVDENLPSEGGFKQMLSDVLKIAQGNPPKGTQDFSNLSNGAKKLNNSTEKTMRFFVECARFLTIAKGNKIQIIPFSQTDCGKAILKAMEANDKRE
jgi:hypothetical protein